MDEETLLYLEETHQVLCLNAPASRIWALCDGERTVEAIAHHTQLSTPVVAKAVEEMLAAGLLLSTGTPAVPSRRSRRRLLVGALVALPVILTVTAPRALAAASCLEMFVHCSPGNPKCCAGLTCTGHPPTRQ